MSKKYKITEIAPGEIVLREKRSQPFGDATRHNIPATEITLTTLRCLKCRYEWIPRKPGRPLTCPKCRQAGWDRPRKKQA